MALLSFKKRKESGAAAASPFAKATEDKKANKTAAKKPVTKKTHTKKVETTSPVVVPGGSWVARCGLQLLLTEKSVLLQENSVVAFRVRPTASKHHIALAVTEKYQVGVLSIRTMRMRGKGRRRGATLGQTSAWKKAYVEVDDVQKITTGP